MTQEDKELLLKDLGARLFYKVVAQVSYKDGEGWKTEDRKVLGVYTDEQVYVDCVYTNIENTKPYLRPMSSMTEEERYEIQGILGKDIEIIDDFINIIDSSRKRFSFLELQAVFDWLNAHHFDYRGLIEKGLALEATEDMYYIPETIKEDKPINFSKLNDDMYNKEGWITIRDGLKMDREGHIAGGLKLK